MWTKETPKIDGYYWHRKNQYKATVLYHFTINMKESVGKEYNILLCRRCGGLFDLERPEDLKGEWYGPLTTPD